MISPKVSVILPAFNSAGLIKDTIETVINQTLSDFELIIVDDGSTDDTFTTAHSIKDPRIKYLQKNIGGPASARNLGLKVARGEYIAYCDGDDRFDKDHLMILADYLDKHVDIDLVYSKGIIVGEEGKRLGTWPEQGGVIKENLRQRMRWGLRYRCTAVIVLKKQGTGMNTLTCVVQAKTGISF
ncbi:hypothetical protein A2625_07570 [candidate division WOR-1 bacterium RIFCSPHIGHO2_01_FULL_53_15]|uniref:Glycosyltransferase 2-like domain-containing protein n=1 Tax=candidate division WOR-1 bacterium RIFCSPHIGHO2_01_FULL_53_15 TaxID=1802564 RepID=A0A1F4Q4K6_UNCSA|nr:MAG: hypothetical protein A2625_07570 [candidate division WOR-1 bacterium RIFCSPHIGHO2_01_FULL_53_15]OGC10568.1 MAG: hypothetical protein A3D23_01595 [candidate division WOR-1 bacterium RIFCSPHIGHO2_02_FULL_53_26]